MKNYNSSRRLFLCKSSIAVAGVAMLSSNNMLAYSVDSQEPYEGYNPYTEETTDLRPSFSLDSCLTVQGVLYAKDGITAIPNAKIEVWHLSPNSSKYRHRGYLYTDAKGSYLFKTNFPNRVVGLKPRINFKVTHDRATNFTQLILDKNHAYISSDHWEKNKTLEKRVFPKLTKGMFGDYIEFNFTI